MADFYEQATVNTMIPEQLVTPLEHALLSGCGFECAEDSGNLYFFAESYVQNDESNLKIQRAELETDKSPLARRIKTYLRGKDADEGEDADIIDVTIPDVIVGWRDLFQSILKKPGNKGKMAIKEIVVKEAYTSKKKRPDSFGGWVVRITRTKIQGSGTHQILEAMRKGGRAKTRF